MPDVYMWSVKRGLVVFVPLCQCRFKNHYSIYACHNRLLSGNSCYFCVKVNRIYICIYVYAIFLIFYSCAPFYYFCFSFVGVSSFLPRGALALAVSTHVCSYVSPDVNAS